MLRTIGAIMFLDRSYSISISVLMAICLMLWATPCNIILDSLMVLGSSVSGMSLPSRPNGFPFDKYFTPENDLFFFQNYLVHRPEQAARELDAQVRPFIEAFLSSAMYDGSDKPERTEWRPYTMGMFEWLAQVNTYLDRDPSELSRWCSEYDLDQMVLGFADQVRDGATKLIMPSPRA